MYQLICCIFCCQLLCFYPQTVIAKRKRGKALKRYLTNMKKAGALFTRHTIKYDDLKTMLNRYKKRNSKPRYRRKRNVHINFAPHIGVDLPTNVVKCRIFCRSGLYLQLLPNGVVKGTVNSLDKHSTYLSDNRSFKRNNLLQFHQRCFNHSPLFSMYFDGQNELSSV